jgi:hypothetical protein
MNARSRVTERGLRKRLLRIEAESHRVEIAANWREFRKPATHLKSIPVWLGIFSLLGLFLGKSRGVGSAATLLGALRLDGLAKLLPLLASGWRALGALRGMASRISMPKRLRFR